MKRLLIFLLLFVRTVFAQQLDLQQQLPVDPNVHFGKLPNGLQYWIRSHKTPPGKVGIWLHVDSGSLNEEENQRGLAHFLEHMAFNGTQHYPPDTLIKYFESIGMRFGQHQNAFTSFDQTTYVLSLPDTKPETIQKGLEVLGDFAFRISLSPEEIEKERPVILAEARARKGVGQRLMEKALPILLPGSRLAVRLPIGAEEVIQKADRNAFLEYYKKWYRPNDSTLLVVGDVTPLDVAKQIEKEFGGWKPLENPSRDFDTGIQPYKETKPAVITDPELTTTEVSTVRVKKLERLQTTGQFRSELIDDLATFIVNRRLLALIEEGNAPYQTATVTIAPFQNQYVIQEASASGAPEQWKQMLTTLLTEIKRARDFGFLPSELDDAKKSIVAFAEQAGRTEATLDASSFLSRMNNAVSLGHKPMSAEQNLELTRALLPQIQLQEVGDAFRDSFSNESRLVMITMPQKEELQVPTEPEIAQVATTVETQTLTQQKEKERPSSLIEKEPEPGTIAKQEEDADTKILSATLSNDFRIHLREMDFKKNNVSAMIRLSGGELFETEKNRGITEAAALPFSQPATKKYSSTVIREFMTGKNVSVDGFSADDGIILFVSGSPDDFEEGLRLAYLLLTQPRVEEPALKVWRDESLQAIEQQKTSVEAQVFEKQAELLSNGDPRLKSPTAQQIQAIQTADAQKWLESILARAPVEISIVGDMQRDKMEKLALKYLGSLPKRPFTDPELDKLRTVQVKPGPLSATIEVPTITPRAIVSVGWRGVNLKDVKDRRSLDLAAQILTSRMQSEIREKRGLTYSVDCSNNPATSYPETGFWGSDFSADPEKVQEAAKVAREMMLDFAKNGPTDAEMQTVRNQMKNVLETEQKEPRYWLRILSYLDYRGIRLEDVKNLIPQITSYTREDIIQAVNRYVKPERQIEVVALPKTAPKP